MLAFCQQPSWASVEWLALICCLDCSRWLIAMVLHLYLSLFVCVRVGVCACVSVYVCVWVSVCVYTCPHVSAIKRVYLMICPPVWLAAVQPACLPAFDQSFSHGDQCWTSGFGTTEEGAGKKVEPTFLHSSRTALYYQCLAFLSSLEQWEIEFESQPTICKVSEMLTCLATWP